MSERERTKELIKPILRGKDIKRYSYEWAHLWVINTHNGYTSNLKSKIPPIDIEKYPATKAHLDSHYDTIATRCDQGDTPYHLRNCAYLEDFEKEKIVWNPVSGEYFFTFIKDEFYFNNSLFMITSKTLETRDLYYILGLLNTTLYRWLTIQMTNLITIGKYAYGSKDKIEQLPIPQITKSNKPTADKIIALVDKILQAKEKDPKANTQQLEKEIDALVYQLYHLTDEEIKTIENGQ
ncbi:TaqI-like C-terminal specificity domain-containing protein [Helicobacter pylori]|uniref:TaqI-like C-terminal specificity domain-containing protein n=1 Tax=Helicobacter pylori TaxID=210 RepID=UPI004047FF03